MSIQTLQEALPTWVTMERPTGEPEVTQGVVGSIIVTEVKAFPETPADAQHETFADAPPDQVRAHVHFVEIAPTADFPDKDELIRTVRAAFGDGEFGTMSAEDMAGGPSYINLGGWLGSQDLALMLIGAVELAGIAKAVTPRALGMSGPMADMMAGQGLVFLGPFDGWTES